MLQSFIMIIMQMYKICTAVLMYSIQIYLHNLLTSAVGLFSGTKSPKKLIQAGFNN